MTHYYTEKPEGSKRRFDIKIKVLGTELDMVSADSIFSKEELDSGTRVLLENCIINEKDYVLDIGCGYGAVGAVVSKVYGAKVMMTDINELAVSVSSTNIRKLRMKDAVAKKSDLYDNISESFDVILSNPPQSAGKDVCFKIIDGAFTHLNKDGSLQLVARPNKGGKTLAEKMESVFGNVEKIGKGSGFTVYMSRKTD